jgi:hypothetical protein
MKPLTKIGINLILVPITCLYAQLATAQVKIQPSNFSGDTVLQPSHEIRLKLDRLPTPEEGKLAIFIGRTDVTSQFRLVGPEFVYQPGLFLLPAGESKVIVYLVKGDNWQEVAQFPIKVAELSQVANLPQSGHISQSGQQPEGSKPQPEKSNSEGITKPQSQETKPAQEPTQQPSQEVTQQQTQQQFQQNSQEQTQQQSEKPPENLSQSATQPATRPSKPSTSAADLSNVFQPQRPKIELPQFESIQAKPDTPPADFTSSFKGRMNVNVKSQFLDQRDGDTEPSERPTFTDTTVETGFDSEIASGTFRLQSRFSLLGVTFQPEALRFGELGENAPKFDLSEYQVDATWGAVQFTLGHLCYGNHPFLLNNVCSRGMTFKVNLGDRVDVSVNSMSATSIIGFDNMTGLNEFTNNNITAATLGFQLVKNDFGGIRFEATVMDGKRKAASDFNESEVVDVEKSRGFGFRLFGTDNSGRLRIDLGYARSTFTNPPDRQLVDAGPGAEEPLADEFVEAEPLVEEPPLENPIFEPPLETPIVDPPLDPPVDVPIVEEPIVEEPIVEEPSLEEPLDEAPIPEEFVDGAPGAQEIRVVPVKPVTKTAFYADVSYDLLKDVKLGSDRTLSLALNARHERVDPQFQTIGATVTADQLRTLVGLNASIAGATIQFQQEWLEDNLANVPTVLKTKTRNTSMNVNVPLQSVLGSSNRFLPTLNYSYQRVQQFGANVPIPELSGFDPTEIPNQINQQHQAGVQWTFDELSFGYTFSSSFQDNRQPSREKADFFNLNHQLSFSWQPSSRFQLTVGYNWASAESQEEGITRFNASPTIGLNWELIKNLTLALNYNTTRDRDSFNQKFTQATGFEGILTWRFAINSGNGSQIPGNAFIRYSRQSNLNRDNVFGLSTDSTVQVINAGFSISF